MSKIPNSFFHHLNLDDKAAGTRRARRGAVAAATVRDAHPEALKLRRFTWEAEGA